eukprot:6254837-Amphidinium_carterae.1
MACLPNDSGAMKPNVPLAVVASTPVAAVLSTYVTSSCHYEHLNSISKPREYKLEAWDPRTQWLSPTRQLQSQLASPATNLHLSAIPPRRHCPER